MRAPLALALGYLLLLGSWAVSNPPGAAPDEVAHYLRAMAAGRGDLVLNDRPEPLTGGAASKKSLQFQRNQTRVVEVPASLSPELFNCDRAGSVGSWNCPQAEPAPEGRVRLKTWVGTYPPYLYAVPGFFMPLADTASGALIVGRLVSASLAFGLLAAAILLLYDHRRGWSSVVGLIAGVTPMAIFVGSSLTPNGSEIAAGACFAAALLRLTRTGVPDGGGPDRFGWTAAGLSGLVLVSARDLGPVWLLLHVALIAGLAGLRPLLAVTKRGGRPALGALALIGLGLAAALYWQLVHQERAQMDVARLTSFFGESLNVSREVARQEIGVFGALAVVMAPWAYLAWGLMLSTVAVIALVAGDLRERALLVLAGAGVVLVPAGIDMLQRLAGFGVQGRHAMPFTIAFPLLAGQVIHGHAADLRWLERCRPSLVLGVPAAGVLGYAWYLNSKFYMVGLEGPDPFWWFVEARPPVGWPYVAAAVAGGVTLIGLFGYMVASRSGSGDHHRADGAIQERMESRTVR